MAGSAGLQHCSDLGWGPCAQGWQERGQHPTGRLAQSTKSSQNSKMQQLMDTVSDVSPVNSRQEDNFNPRLGLGLKFSEDILCY